jgi:hypothetical protein
MHRQQLLRKNWRQLEALKINLRELDAVKFRYGKEAFSHRIAKFVVCHLLTEAGHRFKTEQPINEAICDVIDLDNFVIYEIESCANSSIIKKKLNDFLHPVIEDLMILDLRKMGIDWEPILAFRDQIKEKCRL